MTLESSRPILVTGAHRTGTTWVGRLLAAAPGVAYLSEPMNVLHRPGVFRAAVPRWYTYICPENEQEFLGAFHELLAYKYHLGHEIAAIRSTHDLLRMGRDLAIFAGGRLARRIPLLKDPFAVFSLVWFGTALRCRIVVTVRHPAAFASGLKRLGWSFDFGDLLQQPLLMRDHLEPFRDAMVAALGADVIQQAGLLWKIIYLTLQRFIQSNPEVVVAHHEALALDPVNGFRSLFDQTGLAYTSRVERTIRESSSPENPQELSRSKTHSVRMDSRASTRNWRQRLSSDEVDRVRSLTDGAWQLYYSDESWR